MWWTSSGIGSHVLHEVSRVWRCRGSKYSSLPQCLHLQCILSDQGRALLAYLLRNMSLSKQARKRTFQESWEEKYFCSAQDDNVRCLLCSKVQKGAHKWNIKRHYDTVLCSKSAAGAANLSIFTLRHVNCGLRCATSSWGHVEYMIADACPIWQLHLGITFPTVATFTITLALSLSLSLSFYLPLSFSLSHIFKTPLK